MSEKQLGVLQRESVRFGGKIHSLKITDCARGHRHNEPFMLLIF
jgi:hypothetical protein